MSRKDDLYALTPKTPVTLSLKMLIHFYIATVTVALCGYGMYRDIKQDLIDVRVELRQSIRDLQSSDASLKRESVSEEQFREWLDETRKSNNTFWVVPLPMKRDRSASSDINPPDMLMAERKK